MKRFLNCCLPVLLIPCLLVGAGEGWCLAPTLAVSSREAKFTDQALMLKQTAGWLQPFQKAWGALVRRTTNQLRQSPKEPVNLGRRKIFEEIAVRVGVAQLGPAAESFLQKEVAQIPLDQLENNLTHFIANQGSLEICLHTANQFKAAHQAIDLFLNDPTHAPEKDLENALAELVKTSNQWSDEARQSLQTGGGFFGRIFAHYADQRKAELSKALDRFSEEPFRSDERIKAIGELCRTAVDTPAIYSTYHGVWRQARVMRHIGLSIDVPGLTREIAKAELEEQLARQERRSPRQYATNLMHQRIREILEPAGEAEAKKWEAEYQRLGLAGEYNNFVAAARQEVRAIDIEKMSLFQTLSERSAKVIAEHVAQAADGPILTHYMSMWRKVEAEMVEKGLVRPWEADDVRVTTLELRRKYPEGRLDDIREAYLRSFYRARLHHFQKFTHPDNLVEVYHAFSLRIEGLSVAEMNTHAKSSDTLFQQWLNDMGGNATLLGASVMTRPDSSARKRTRDGKFTYEAGGSPEDVLKNVFKKYKGWVLPTEYYVHVVEEIAVKLQTIKNDFRANVDRGYMKVERGHAPRGQLAYRLTDSGIKEARRLLRQAV